MCRYQAYTGKRVGIFVPARCSPKFREPDCAEDDRVALRLGIGNDKTKGSTIYWTSRSTNMNTLDRPIAAFTPAGYNAARPPKAHPAEGRCKPGPARGQGIRLGEGSRTNRAR